MFNESNKAALDAFERRLKVKKFTRGFNKTTRAVEDNPFLSVACKSESLCDYGEQFSSNFDAVKKLSHYFFPLLLASALNIDIQAVKMPFLKTNGL